MAENSDRRGGPIQQEAPSVPVGQIVTSSSEDFIGSPEEQDSALLVPSDGIWSRICANRCCTNMNSVSLKCGGCSGNGNCMAYCSLAVLTFVNLLNYMDRFTLAGNGIGKFVCAMFAKCYNNAAVTCCSFKHLSVIQLTPTALGVCFEDRG